MASRKSIIFTLGLLVCSCTAQQDKDRISQLEKQTKELQEQLKRQTETASLEEQAKCALDAKAFFRETLPQILAPQTETTALDYTNHFNKPLSKCFILIDYRHVDKGHTDILRAHLVINQLLYDVYENNQYGILLEETKFNPFTKDNDTTTPECDVLGKRCHTRDEFSRETDNYMKN